jgi:phenylacetaldehyde dehydrogenase
MASTLTHATAWAQTRPAFLDGNLKRMLINSVWVEAAQKIKLGPGFAPDTDMGPLVSQEQLQRVSGYLTSGFAQGARVLSGGKRYSDRGYFVEPTVLVDPTRDMQVVREEIFGAVVTAMPFEDLNDLVRQANDTTYGLARCMDAGH